MLTRSLTRTVFRRIAQLATHVDTPCVVCLRGCGRLFSSNHGVQQHRASGASRKGRAAPTTRLRDSREKPMAYTPKLLKQKNQAASVADAYYLRQFQRMKIAEQISMAPQTAIEFVRAFTELAVEAKAKKVVDLKRLQEMVDENHLDLKDLFTLCTPLLVLKREHAIGEKLLSSLSALGSEDATMRLLNHALLSNRVYPGLLRSSDILQARGHLRDIARKGENYRAMVLEGKIAYELGDEEYAIRLWTQAMGAAVAASEKEAALQARGRIKELRQLNMWKERDLSELSSPWLELTAVHVERYQRYRDRKAEALAEIEYAAARKAVDIGCEQDDPTSHYHAADSFKELVTEFAPDGTPAVDDKGNRVYKVRYTSTWLYHMTKAAASGHVKAAHAMAEYYASTGWKYIEDEPPDHIKPTPFDSYPAPTPAPAASSWRSLLGLPPANYPPSDPREHPFFTAVFPDTPSTRQQLALFWLAVAIRAAYAPSSLFAAQMLLEEHHWGEAYAPPSALDLSPDRYTWASKADADAGIPIQRAATFPISDPQNLARNPAGAKIFLTDVFYALEAHHFRQRQILRARETRRRRHTGGHTDVEDVEHDEMLPEIVPERIKKWLRNSDVRALWEAEADSLERDAKQICEEQKWDIHDDHGGLLYRHGLSKARTATRAFSTG